MACTSTQGVESLESKNNLRYSVGNPKKDWAETERLDVAWKRARTWDRARDAPGSTGVHVICRSAVGILFF